MQKKGRASIIKTMQKRIHKSMMMIKNIVYPTKEIL